MTLTKLRKINLNFERRFDEPQNDTEGTPKKAPRGSSVSPELPEAEA